MRIAVPSEDALGLDGRVAHHFGRCPYFAFVDVGDEGIEAVTVVSNPHYGNHQPGAVPAFVRSYEAEVIVTGGMGRRAVALFEELGVQPFTGATGTVQEAVTSALAGGLGQVQPCAGRGGCDEHDQHQHS